MGTWNNDDGLYIKFGTDEATATIGGNTVTADDYQMVSFDLDLTTLGATAAIVSDNIFIPANARVDKVEIITTTAADSSGDSGVLNIGTIRKDRTTEIDYDGLVAAMVQGNIDAAGETQEVVIGHTYVGADVGTTTAYAGYITADYDTAAFTAGEVKVRIFYRMIS